MSRELAAALASSRHFADFGDTELVDVAGIFEPAEFDAGETIFREGELGKTLLLIASGTVALSKRVAGGGRVDLGTLKPGDITGEMSIVDGSPRSATATALDQVSGFTASRHAFEARRIARMRGIQKLMWQFAVVASERYFTWIDSLDVIPPEAGVDEFPAPVAARPPQEMVLRSLPLIGSGAMRDVSDLLTGAQQYALPMGAQLAPVAGRRGNLYLLLSGAVQARLQRRSGVSPTETLGPGSLVGSASALTGRNGAASFRVREPAVVVEFLAADVQAWLSEHSRFKDFFQDSLCRQAFYDLRVANRRQAWIAAQDSGLVTA